MSLILWSRVNQQEKPLEISPLRLHGFIFQLKVFVEFIVMSVSSHPYNAKALEDVAKEHLNIFSIMLYAAPKNHLTLIRTKPFFENCCVPSDIDSDGKHIANRF